MTNFHMIHPSTISKS